MPFRNIKPNHPLFNKNGNGQSNNFPQGKKVKWACTVLGHQGGLNCDDCAKNNKNSGKVKQKTTPQQQQAAEPKIQKQTVDRQSLEEYLAQLKANRSELVHICFENPVTEKIGDGLCKDLAIEGPLNFTHITEVFSEAFRNNSGSIYIPNFESTGITALHGSVFYDANLKGDYQFPTTLELISDFCFYRSRIKSVTINHAIATQGINIFSECLSLETVTLGEGVEKVANGMFSKCKKIKTITIPETCKEVGIAGFKGCLELNNATFLGNPELIIKDEAFQGCSNLTTVSFGNGVKEIRDRAFYGAKIEGSLSIPNTCEVIGNQAFKSSIKGAQTSFPTTAAYTIGKEAFAGCELTSILTIRKAIAIGESAFSGVKWGAADSALITLGDSPKIIHDNAFRNIPSNTTISVNFNSSAWVGGDSLKCSSFAAKYKREVFNNRNITVMFGGSDSVSAGPQTFKPKEHIKGDGTKLYSTTYYESEATYPDAQNNEVPMGILSFHRDWGMWHLYWSENDDYDWLSSIENHPQDEVQVVNASGLLATVIWDGQDSFIETSRFIYKGQWYEVLQGQTLLIGESPESNPEKVTVWAPTEPLFNGGTASFTIPAVKNGSKEMNLSVTNAHESSYLDDTEEGIAWRDKVYFAGEINWPIDKFD